MTRAETRRKKRQEPVIQPYAPLIDFVIWAGDGHDVTACVASLPTSGVTVTTCGKTDGSPYVARNKAAAKGRAPFIAFVDADCMVEAATLPAALAHLQAGAAVVGGLLVTSGRVFCAGYAFNIEARPFFRFANWDAGAAKVQERRTDIQAVPLQLLLTRRDVFRTTRFREEYGETAYGDADYCLRVKAKGGVVYEPRLRAETQGALLMRPSDVGAMMLRSTGLVVYDELNLL